MLKISGLVDRQYVISVHPVIGSEKMSFWSLSWETFKDRRDIFTLGGGGAGPGPGASNPATAACIAATNWASRAAPVGGGPGGLARSLAKAARLLQARLLQASLTPGSQNVPFSKETVKRPCNQPAI